jgi:hypothetical protein
MGIVLIIAGLIIWLALNFHGHFLLGLILVILGVLALFAPWDGAYGYTRYRGRRGPL